MDELNIDSLEIPEAPDLEIPDLEMPDLDLSDLDLSDIGMPGGEAGLMNADMAGEIMGDAGITDMEMPAIPDSGEGFSLEDIEMPESDREFNLEDIDMSEMSADDLFQGNEPSIDGLDQAIQSETELQMAGELNIDELVFDNISAGDGDAAAELADLSMPDDSESENDLSIDMDDNLEDVLNMLDDDAELAEINDMLKKSDNNEPIQDDMMDLLHQMADDEAASVNAGMKHVDDDDDGVPLPEMPRPVPEVIQDEPKKKDKKAAAKKKKGDYASGDDAGAERVEKPGKLSKFFNLLTEELVPEPTEEELAAEKEAKEAKKQENLTKKEEEKLAKQEAKKAKAEEKAAADRVKQEAAAQKKKEKLARKAAKKAKLAAEGPKKRIPPKKIAVAAAFGASVGGAVVLATNILSTQGFLQTARNAYYDGDYKTVYEATYGMELDDSGSDGLIKARSEVIFKVQRRFDSYQTYVRMGREVEALDALLNGLAAYDAVNADAEKYGVMAEIEAVRAEILNTLESKYGLDETGAREIINTQDALAYTIALNKVIAGN